MWRVLIVEREMYKASDDADYDDLLRKLENPNGKLSQTFFVKTKIWCVTLILKNVSGNISE